MFAWTFTILLALIGVWLLLRELDVGGSLFGMSAERRDLERVVALLQEFEESLSAGLVPSAERWNAIGTLPRPWGPLVHECITELRSTGGSLVPTLRRLRALAQDHQGTISHAKAKVAQSLAQAFACLLLVPIFGGALYLLLPGIDSHPVSWIGACVFSFFIAGLGAMWMTAMASAARWGGLRGETRGSILVAYCGGERFLALLRAGTPADLAWSRTVTLIEKEATELGRLWGRSIWEKPKEAGARKIPALDALAQAGEGIKKAVQVSLMDGRPCTERVEVVLMSLRKDWDALVERELGLLATRTLKPLFLCVAPALVGLLFFGVAQVWFEVVGGGGIGV